MESFVCYRVIDLIASCLLCIWRVYLLEVYLKRFIRIFLYDYDFILIRILLINWLIKLFIYLLFIYLFIYSFSNIIVWRYSLNSVQFRDVAKTSKKSKMERFATIVNVWKPFTFALKLSIFNVCVIPGYVSVISWSFMKILDIIVFFAE